MQFVIGRNGFGVVYLGKNDELRTDVAIGEDSSTELSVRTQEFGSFRGDWGNSRDGHHVSDRELCLVSLSLPQSGFRAGRAGSDIRPLASGERCNTAKPQGKSEGLAGIQA